MGKRGGGGDANLHDLLVEAGVGDGQARRVRRRRRVLRGPVRAATALVRHLRCNQTNKCHPEYTTNIILQEQQYPTIRIHCHNVRVCPQRHCRQAHVSRCGCAVCTRPYACDLNNLGWVGGRRGADLASHYSINTCFTVVKCFSVELGRVQLFA